VWSINLITPNWKTLKLMLLYIEHPNTGHLNTGQMCVWKLNGLAIWKLDGINLIASTRSSLLSFSFYHRALSSGHVTVTDGDCRLLHKNRHVITQQSYQLWKVRSTCSLSPWIASDVLTSTWWSGILLLACDSSMMHVVIHCLWVFITTR
jgi:hypothetical protein